MARPVPLIAEVDGRRAAGGLAASWVTRSATPRIGGRRLGAFTPRRLSPQRNRLSGMV